VSNRYIMTFASALLKESNGIFD